MNKRRVKTDGGLTMVCVCQDCKHHEWEPFVEVNNCAFDYDDRRPLGEKAGHSGHDGIDKDCQLEDVEIDVCGKCTRGHYDYDESDGDVFVCSFHDRVVDSDLDEDGFYKIPDWCRIGEDANDHD